MMDMDPEESSTIALQADDAKVQGTTALEDALAHLLEETEAVHSELDTQKAWMDRTERDLQSVAETLLNQIIDLEKQSRLALQAIEAQAAQGTERSGRTGRGRRALRDRRRKTACEGGRSAGRSRANAAGRLQTDLAVRASDTASQVRP